MTLKEMQEMNIIDFVIMCAIIASIMAGFTCCCQSCGGNHEEWAKKQHEKYLEGYRSRMAGNTGINWDR